MQRDHPLYAAVVAAAKIHQRTGGESVCVLKVDRTWDHVLTVQDALDVSALLEAECFASVTRRRVEVLRKRSTWESSKPVQRSSSRYPGIRLSGYYMQSEPAWPSTS